MKITKLLLICCENCWITVRITARFWEKLHNLKYLWLSKNKLRELPVDEVRAWGWGVGRLTVGVEGLEGWPLGLRGWKVDPWGWGVGNLFWGKLHNLEFWGKLHSLKPKFWGKLHDLGLGESSQPQAPLALSNNKLRELPVDEVKIIMRIATQNNYENCKTATQTTKLLWELPDYYDNYCTVLRKAS